MKSPLRRGRVRSDGIELDSGGREPMQVLAHSLGIESPGLTASFAVGDEVLRMLDG